MKFTTKSLRPEAQEVDCLIVGVYEDYQMSPAANFIDNASQGYLRKLMDQKDITGSIGQTLLLHNLPNIKASRVLVVGCGNPNQLSDSNYKKICTTTALALKKTPSNIISSYLTELVLSHRNIAWKIRQHIECLEQSYYHFDQFKSQKHSYHRPIEISFYSHDEEQKLANQAIKEGAAIAKGLKLTKDLGNTPGNVCTPTYLAEQALELAKQYPQLKVTVLEKNEIEKLGMGALLAVSQGSIQPPRLITLEYRGGAVAEQPVVLVGKGITFDSGGLSIKASLAMDEMKFDMCGAASVLSALMIAAELNLPINLVGVIAAAENMPSGTAYKPGDIVKTLSGLTVEIINTDSEGRLILCDALSFSEKFNPAIVIDVATLTSGIIVALGAYPSGLYCNDDTLAAEIINAADQSYDRVWRMPLWDDYLNALESNFADIANRANETAAAANNAAIFLSRFTKKFPWAHIDTCATAYKSGKEKGATGRPVSLLAQLLLNRSHAAH